MRQNKLIYEDHPPYAWWLIVILGWAMLLTLALGTYFMTIDMVAAAIMYGVTVFDSLLFYFILPRRYQIYTDRMIIKLGGPFSIKVKLSEIKSAKQVSGGNALASWGIRFATSTRYVVGITRNRGLDVVISPGKGDLFLEQLNLAIKQNHQ